LHDGHGLLLFNSFLLHYRRSFDSEQMGGWTSFLLHPKDSGVLLHLKDTLVFNDCMEWANSALGWLSPGLARSKDSFSFWWTCAISGYQKGLGLLCRDQQRLSILETDTQFTRNSYILDFSLCDRMSEFGIA